MGRNYEEGVLRTLQTALEKRKQEIFARAQEEIRHIQEEAEAQREQILARRLRQLQQEMAVERARELGRAHREAREEVLAAKYEVIRAIEERVRQRLGQLTEADWQQTLVRWFQELVPYLKEAEGEVIVRVPAGAAAPLERALKDTAQGLRVRFQADPSLEQGIVVEDAARGFRVQNTLEDRFRRARIYMLERMAHLLEQWEGES